MLVFAGYVVGLEVLNPCCFFARYIVGLEVLTPCCFLLGI